MVTETKRPATASELMERDVITVSLDTRILDVHRLFVEEEIHGAPVVAEDGRVRGVISTIDLLRIVHDELTAGASPSASYYRDELPYSAFGTCIPAELADATAADAMTKSLVTVEPGATIEDIAKTMLEHRVHRVLVVADGVLEGVITSFDMLRAFAREAPRPVLAAVRQTGYRR
jgi:CBS domain-containing protein